VACAPRLDTPSALPPQAAPKIDPARLIEARGTPKQGRVLFFVGQDGQAIDDYAKAVWPSPGGVTSYTNLSEGPSAVILEGLAEPANHGAGVNHAAPLLEQFPRSAWALGLYLVDHTGTNLEHIRAGVHDAHIERLGRFLVRSRRPVFLRIGYEFDGVWNEYLPDEYRAAFRHIVERLRALGVTNFVSVWQSATYAGGTYKQRSIDSWYPGDDVVDWVGSSYFKFAPEAHDALLAFARDHRKPVFIAESAPQGYDLEASTFSDDGQAFESVSAERIWGRWYAPFFAFVRANADVIRAVAYINTAWKNQPMWSSGEHGYWGDSRVQASPLILDRFKHELSSPMWQHSVTDFGEALVGF
jgi:hypothetical protein